MIETKLESINYISQIVDRCFPQKEDIYLQFSIYKSGGKGVTLSRVIFDIKLNYNFINSLNEVISNLKENEELALHSKVIFSNNEFHLPLIDFSTHNSYKLLENIFKIKKINKNPIYIFSSGRSYHGYIQDLIPKDKWYKYLGELLLLNEREMPFELVDSRWIGHSIVQGYSAIRLTCNSSQYLKHPTLLDIF